MLPTYLAKLALEDSWKWILAGMAVILDFVFPAQIGREMAIAAFVLIALDTITGFVSALVAGQAISSARFSRVLVKLLGYGSVIIVSAIVTKFVHNAETLPNVSVTAVLTLVIATEAISVLENVRRMGIKLPLGLDKWLEERLKKPNG